jgi:hypothetical protein
LRGKIEILRKKSKTRLFRSKKQARWQLFVEEIESNPVRAKSQAR